MTIIDEPNTIGGCPMAAWKWECKWNWERVPGQLSRDSRGANTRSFDGQYILIKIDDVDTNFERAPNKRWWLYDRQALSTSTTRRDVDSTPPASLSVSTMLFLSLSLSLLKGFLPIFTKCWTIFPSVFRLGNNNNNSMNSQVRVSHNRYTHLSARLEQQNYSIAEN